MEGKVIGDILDNKAYLVNLLKEHLALLSKSVLTQVANASNTSRKEKGMESYQRQCLK